MYSGYVFKQQCHWFEMLVPSGDTWSSFRLFFFSIKAPVFVDKGSYALGEFLFTLQKYLSSVPFYKCERWF